MTVPDRRPRGRWLRIRRSGLASLVSRRAGDPVTMTATPTAVGAEAVQAFGP